MASYKCALCGKHDRYIDSIREYDGSNDANSAMYHIVYGVSGEIRFHKLYPIVYGQINKTVKHIL